MQHNVRTFCYLTALLLAAGLFSTWYPVEATTPPSRLPRPMGSSQPFTPAPFTPDAFAWVDEVWQSHRTGNWELYHAPFAKEAVQLTNHPAADTLPRLNVGSTQIVFVSDRDGNEEIYVINIDGSGLTRLTADGAKDTLPYWSPDGSKLIFSSQRTGNGDLYLMNADGSGLRQITSDGTEDTYPSWSPDGGQLLWVRLYPIVRQRPQEGELWVANADGTNARAITGRLRTPARPLIAPNGARIAFDADLDQDGLLDLVLMERDGAGAFIYVPGDVGILRWMGSWEPDSTTLWVTKFTYRVDQDGRWSLEHTDIEQLCLDNRPGCGSLVPGDQQVMMPDRQLADLQVPTSQVDPLPAYVRLNGFTVRWSGKEYGPSGFVGFDVQYRREGAATWQDWWQGTNSNPDILPGAPRPANGSSFFYPEGAGRYYFRSRSLDYAGNSEAWPANATGDTATTVFSWYLSGQVTDGRGVPYAQQPLALQPAALEPIVTDQQGNFQVRIGEPGAYTLAQELTLQMDQDRTTAYYRLPADNILQNSSFEAPLGAGNWQISGTVALTQSHELVHSGQQAVRLGRSCSQKCLTTLPSSGVADLSQQALVVDSEGALHLFARKAPSTLIHQMRTPEGEWLPYTPLANGVANWSSASVLDKNGALHLVWSVLELLPGDDKETLYYARYQRNQGWSQPETLGSGSSPQLAIDGQQQLHLLYQCSSGAECQLLRMGYRKRTAAGSWSAPKILATDGFLNTGQLAALDNTVYVSWVERNSNLEHLFVATVDDGALTNRQLLDLAQFTPEASRYVTIRLLADRQQRLHLAWTATNEAAIYYTHKVANGTWQPIDVQQAEGPNPIYLHSALVDQQDSLHLITPRSSQYPTLHWHRSPDGRWSPMQALPLFDDRNFQLSTVAIGLHNELYFGLQNFDPVTQIKVTTAVTATATSQLRQSVTIPAILHQPTLSFLYQLSGEGMHGSALSLLVHEGLTTTTVFSTSAASGWQLGWADLTPWQGKTVTVTFQSTQAVGDQYLQATVDRVALGSWRTPRPQALSPTALPWGTGGTLTVTGTNFIATPQVFVGDRALSNGRLVDAATVSATLPADLPPGRYTVWVVNPGGERNAVPMVLAVGEESFLPVVHVR